MAGCGRAWPPTFPACWPGWAGTGDLVEAVWEDAGGGLRSRLLDETDYPPLPALPAGRLCPGAVDVRAALRTAVLPDVDGWCAPRWLE